MTTPIDFLAEALVAPNAGDAIRADLIAAVETDWANHPRSLQTAIGPSEIGVPCSRQIAAKLAGAQRTNPSGDLLPAYIGTATHARLEESFEADNRRLFAEGRGHRWLTEQRVTVAPGLSGSCDLYSSWDGGMVIDHKVVGATSFRKYLKEGPSEQYRVQAHSYGLGFQNAGYPVARVGIFFIPKSSYLSKSFVWSEPFDPAVALNAVDRLEKIRNAVDLIGAVDDHSQLDRVPARSGDHCTFCPFGGKSSENVWACSRT